MAGMEVLAGQRPPTCLTDEPATSLGGESVKRHTLFNVLGLLVIASLALAACGTPTPTEAPAPTEPPPPAPTEEGMAPLVGTCDNGSTVAQVAAVDRYTAEFTLCGPDAAFLSKIAFTVFGIYPSEWLEATTH